MRKRVQSAWLVDWRFSQSSVFALPSLWRRAATELLTVQFVRAQLVAGEFTGV